MKVKEDDRFETISMLANYVNFIAVIIIKTITRITDKRAI